MKRLLLLLAGIPAWAWMALVVALCVLSGYLVMQSQVDAARADAASARAALAQERAWHMRELADAETKLRIAEGDLRDALDVQQHKDAEHETTVASLREDLRRSSRSAGGAGLRDPFAPACPDHADEPETATAAAGGGENAAEAGRVLSAELEGLLLVWFAEADDINIAYESCRADALTLRAKMNDLRLSPSPGPASAGPP